MSSKETIRKLTLYPLSKLYGFGVAVRNRLFDWGFIKQTEFDVPVIVVGNLAVGGTGKTPHTEFIVRLLRDNFNIGILSRGYKRETKGFVLVTTHSTPRDIGDEAYQMYHKFARKIMVAVCEKRVDGIRKMLEINPSINLIILDDAFQHRYVKPKVAILLTEFFRPYYEDEMLPYGRLRESKDGASRSDMVIVTKCPPEAKPFDYRVRIKNLNLIPDQGLFFSQYRYDHPRPLFPRLVKPEDVPVLANLTQDYTVLAVAGIGNPKPFVLYIKSFDCKVKVNRFPDHHDFTRKDMETLVARFESMPKGRRYIMTTEKDAVRLINNPYFPHALKPYIFFIPIRVTLDEHETEKFKNMLMRRIAGSFL